MTTLLMVLGPRDQLLADMQTRAAVQVDSPGPRNGARYRGLDYGWRASRRRAGKTEMVDIRRVTDDAQVTPEQVGRINDRLADRTLSSVEVHLANGRTWFLAWLANQPNGSGERGSERNRLHDAWPIVEAEVSAGRWTWHTPASAPPGRLAGG